MLELGAIHHELRAIFYIRLLRAITVLMCVVLTALSITSSGPFIEEILISQGIVIMLFILPHLTKN